MPSVLFSPITLRGLTLPNRIAVSPMCQYNSENGSAGDWHLVHLGQMSLGTAMWNPRWSWHAAEALGAETAYAPKMMACHPKLRPQVFPGRHSAA